MPLSMSARRSRSKIDSICFSLNDMWGLIEISGVLASLRRFDRMLATSHVRVSLTNTGLGRW